MATETWYEATSWGWLKAIDVVQDHGYYVTRAGGADQHKDSDHVVLRKTETEAWAAMLEKLKCKKREHEESLRKAIYAVARCEEMRPKLLGGDPEPPEAHVFRCVNCSDTQRASLAKDATIGYLGGEHSKPCSPSLVTGGGESFKARWTT